MSLLQRKIAKKASGEAMPSEPAVMTRKDTPEQVALTLRSLSVSDDDWGEYFEVLDTYEIREQTFAVYRTKLDRAETMFVLLHGAGLSAMSWALVADIMRNEGECGVLAFDMRGHAAADAEGNITRGIGSDRALTRTPGRSSDDQQWDVDSLVADSVSVIRRTMELYAPDVRLILVGHSMGGAIATRCTHAPELRGSVKGLVVLDVVEGTALDALPAMKGVLEKRPTGFPTIHDAIEWACSSGTVHNRHSASLSIPSQLRPCEQGFTWRTDLVASEKFWEGWFTGLSKLYLSAACPKLLILAGTDRLDTELTIGQMQGKFQLLLLPACGHAVQEDAPERVAQSLLEFQRYNQL